MCVYKRCSLGAFRLDHVLDGRQKNVVTPFFLSHDHIYSHGLSLRLMYLQPQQYVRDVRVHQILEGTAEVMKIIISRDVVGKLGAK